MDILSRLFDEMHLQQVQYISVQAGGEWRLEQHKRDYLTFIVVMSGEIVLYYANQYQSITANNMIMLTSKQGYRIQSSPDISKAVTSTDMPAHKQGQINLVINGSSRKNDTLIETHTDTNIERKESEQIKSPQIKSTQIKSTMLARFIVVRSQFDRDMARPLLSSLPDSLPQPTQQHSAYNEVVKIGLQFFQLEVGLQRPGKSTMLERLASMLMIECIREYVEQLETVSSSKQYVTAVTHPTKQKAELWADAPWQLTPKTAVESLADDRSSSATKEHNNAHWLAALKDPYLSKTLYLMHSYPQEAWTLQELAKESGLSRSSLSARFRQLIGITPQAYLSHYRLRLAARFLRQEQYSIGKISELVGYASDHSFSGAFKRRYGQSPSHYRKAFIQKSVK